MEIIILVSLKVVLLKSMGKFDLADMWQSNQSSAKLSTASRKVELVAPTV